MNLLLLGVTGAVSVIGWEPYACWPLLLAAYAVFGWCLARPASALSVAFQGGAFGLGQHLVGHGWVFTSLNDKAGLSTAFAVFGTSIFVVYLALFVALPCFVWAKLRRRDASGTRDACWTHYVALATLLTLGEWARSRFFNGFTSLSTGYALLDTPLSGYAPVLGIYGLSLVFYLLAFLLVYGARLASPVARRQACLGALVLVVVGALGKFVPWVSADARTIGFRLIQANVPQERKFNAAYVPRELEELGDLISRRTATIVVTSETAFPVFFHELPAALMERLHEFSTRTGSHLLLGLASISAAGEGHNSLLHLSPRRDQGLAFFNKTRLMPFGEYSPFGFAWFARQLHVSLKDLQPGIVGQPPFAIQGVGVGPLICHEGLVGDLSRHWAPDVGVLVNPSNLAWFEASMAIGQQLQMTRMRALEVGRPILRVANTGVTAHIDHRGEVVGRIPAEQAGVLDGAVRPTRGLTPYVVWGDWPVVAACLAWLGAMFWRRRRQRQGSAWRSSGK